MFGLKVVVFRKDMDHCGQAEEECDMFDDPYAMFATDPVLKNTCCMCILQIEGVCKLIWRPV